MIVALAGHLYYFTVCIPPSSLSNGGFDISTNQMTLRYSCAVGFTLDGNAVRHCDTEGSGWDGYEPECSKSC